MACKSVSDPRSVPVVLRVKRKRTEDPADALVVTKSRKLDPSLADKDQRIFHFAGTVSEQNLSSKELLARIKEHGDHPSQVKYNPLARLSIAERQQQWREEKKKSSTSQRLKLISKLRCVDDVQESAKTNQDEGKSVEELKRELLHLYDIEKEESGSVTSHNGNKDLLTPSSTCAGNTDAEISVSNGGNGRRDVQSKGVSCTQDLATSKEERLTDSTNMEVVDEEGRSLITCNSMQMIREKTSFKVNGASEYVYDLYYTQDSSQLELSAYDWSSLCTRDYNDHELVHDIIDTGREDYYEDDDDSNDEDNWRNDYPDEGGAYNTDSDEAGDDGRLHYRHREAYLDDNIFGETNHYQDGSYWDSTMDNTYHHEPSAW